MASTSGVADAATRSFPRSIRKGYIHCAAMYVNRLEHSPNIATFDGFEDTSEIHALVLEFVDGGRSLTASHADRSGEGSSRARHRQFSLVLTLSPALRSDRSATSLCPMDAGRMPFW